MTTGSLAAAMLFSASQHIPPVSAPSPTTATTCRLRWPVNSNALDNPSEYDSAAEAWLDSTQSWSLSVRDGYPERPPLERKVSKSAARPVSILCTYA